MNTNTNLVGIEGGGGIFQSQGGGCKKNLGKKIGTLKAGGGKKIDPLARIYTPVAFRHPWHKIIFLSQYLFIAILCVKMSSVYKPLTKH